MFTVAALACLGAARFCAAASPGTDGDKPTKKQDLAAFGDPKVGQLTVRSASVLAPQYDTEVIDGVTWMTNKDAAPLGSPNAKKGGELRIMIQQFLPTLREHGPSANLVTITDIYGLTHEPLLSLHHETRDWVPVVGSHWRVSDDKMTFWFKIDERAKFSNGKSVTADDVIATFEMLTNPDIKDHATEQLFNKYYEKPVAEAKDIVRVKAKVLSWRAMLYFAASMKIYPAADARIPGNVYLDEYNWKQPPGTGPYIIQDPSKDLKDEVSVTLTRRDDYWAADDPGNKGLYNFGKLHFVVVRDRTLAFEKLKAGELDYYVVNRAQRWVEECNFPAVQNGWVQKRKVYNEQPQSFSGYMFNMREKPFDDKNVRLAFAYAYNRERLFDKLFFNQYEFLDSYYPASVWGNPNNRKIRYNPSRAERLLDRAGYTKRNKEGTRVHEKTGAALEFEFEYGFKESERIHRVVAEDLAKVGIRMTLKQVDYNSLIKRIGERKFKLHFQSWRGIAYPNPITSWNSDLANKTDNNNLTGFANKEVDELMAEYDRTFDKARQIENMQRIDSIIFKEYTTALAWYAPFERLVYWNRYGMSDNVLSRFTDQRLIWSAWYLDPEKSRKLDAAIKSNSKLPIGETVVDPWGVKSRTEKAGQ